MILGLISLNVDRFIVIGVPRKSACFAAHYHNNVANSTERLFYVILIIQSLSSWKRLRNPCTLATLECSPLDKTIKNLVDVHTVRQEASSDGLSLGIGDTLLVCAIAEGLRVENPGQDVRLCTIQRHQDWVKLFWQGKIGIEEDLHQNGGFGDTQLFPFNDRLFVMDHKAEGKGMNRHQYCADNIGVREPHLLPVTISDEDQAWASEALKSPIGKNTRILGIAPMSRSVQRHWPMPYWIDFIDQISKMNIHPIFFAEKGDKRVAPLAHLSFIGETPGRVAALLKHCDFYVGPDSALAHLAGLMEIPSIVMCSLTVGKVALGWYQSVHTIQIPGPCTGCMAQPAKGFRFACAAGCSITFDFKPDQLTEAFANQFSARL
jgi:hypothetical protein